MTKLKGFNIKKAVGYDGIPAKLKDNSNSLVTSLTHLINKSISTFVFPNDLEVEQIKPAYKDKDILSKEKYRPIHTLPNLSSMLGVSYP